jgi:hypothetical protein
LWPARAAFRENLEVLMPTRNLVAAIGILLCAAAPAAGQAWDAPSFFAPGAANSLGVYFVDPDRSDPGLVAIWRQGDSSFDLGARVGLLDFSDPLFLVGAEASGAILRAGRDLPLDADWTIGIGATFDDDATLFRIPVGLAVGGAIDAGSVALYPYVHPRIALETFAVDDESETDFNVLADLGLDLRLGRAWLLRFGVTFGDYDALGIGLAWRTARGVRAGSD